jgi:hypothetical protein
MSGPVSGEESMVRRAVVLALLALVFVPGCGRRDDPMEVFDQFREALKERDGETLMELMHPGLRAQYEGLVAELLRVSLSSDERKAVAFRQRMASDLGVAVEDLRTMAPSEVGRRLLLGPTPHRRELFWYMPHFVANCEVVGGAEYVGSGRVRVRVRVPNLDERHRIAYHFVLDGGRWWWRPHPALLRPGPY